MFSGGVQAHEALEKMSNKIGRFEIQAEISRTTTGTVSKACDPAGGQIVALKTVDLKPFGQKGPALVKRILEEAEGSKLLNTHNIAMLFGAGEIEGQFCATMEYVQGNSIETMLARKEVFSIWDVQDIARQGCQGLDHARVNKVLHYSLEPAKIMVQWDGIVKMLGFGVSMMGVFAAEICPDIPKILHYMSPEQLQGAPIDASSNLFSLGAILYEMVTQVKAFEGENANQVRKSILESSPVPPSELNSKIDAALSDVIMKALSKDPAGRYQSGQELINDLEKCKNNPIKSTAANKAAPLPSSFKAPPVVATPAAAASATANAVAPPVAQKTGGDAIANKKASAASAGVGSTNTSSPTLQSLKAAKMESSPQFITSCIKASIDAATQPQPKMSVAAAEPEVKAPQVEAPKVGPDRFETPKITVDPLMDESAKAPGKPTRSFSEIDELPPLKEVYVAPPPPPPGADEEILVDDPTPSYAGNPTSDSEKLPAREIAKKAVAEIKNTPPKMFAYSIGAAIAIILAIGAIIAFRIRSDNAEDETTSPAVSGAASSVSKSAQANGPAPRALPAQPVAQPAELPDEETENSRLSVKSKSAAKKKAKPVTAAPVAPAIIPAQLTINSNPAGAQVQVDGRGDPIWITPYNISGLAPGQHTVYISKAGYSPEIRNVDTISGGKSTIQVNFRQLPITVFFVSAPAGCSIIVDGKDTGQVTPAQISLDRAGSHVFVVKKQGYLEETTTANLTPGQVFHYSPTLIALGHTDEIKTVGKLKKLFGNGDNSTMGTVSARIQPKGAQIAVNGRLLEKLSPVDFYLNPGTYVIDLTLSGYKSARHIVTVTQGGKVTLDDILDPQ